jgi:3-dehydroquinate dehydratase
VPRSSIYYCLPLAGRGWSEIVEQVRAHAGAYRYFEIWPAQAIADVECAALASLAEDFPGRLIFTLREPVALAGAAEPARPPAGSSLAPLALLDGLRVLAPLDVVIDLDVRQQRAALDFLATLDRCTARRLCSLHDYDKTPSADDLLAVATEARALGAWVTKICTYCRSPEEALRLLQLERSLAARGQRHIVLGMGRHGLITRIFATLWGNEFVYAPLTPAAATAPGQLTKTQLETIFAELL